MCYAKNEDVVGAAPTGDAPTTSEWSTIIFPTKLRLILEVWRYCVHIGGSDIWALLVYYIDHLSTDVVSLIALYYASYHLVIRKEKQKQYHENISLMFDMTNVSPILWGNTKDMYFWSI